MALSYGNEKKKYSKIMKNEADKQIKSLKPKDIPSEVIYNKFELHDTRILVGVLTDLLLKKKLITRKELESDIVSAYEDELKAVRK